MISIFRCNRLAGVLVAAWAASAAGQWIGWPVPDSASWGNLEHYGYVSQLHSAIVERCLVAGIAQPSYSNVVSVFGGYAAPATATNPVTGSVFSNPVVTVKTIAVTNLGFFSWTWTNWDGTVGIGTAAVPITRSVLVAMDGAIDQLIPRFVVTNLMSNGTFSAWLNQPGTNGLYPTSIPAETRGGLFSRLGIGYVPSAGTDTWGVVTGAVAYWTRWPSPVTNDWTLAAASWKSNGWWTSGITPLDTRFYSSARPVLKYFPAAGGTGSMGGVTFTLRGTAHRFADQGATSATEVVTLIGTEATLGVAWRVVTNISGSAAPPSTGDSVVVTYAAPFTLYGDIPWRLLSVHLNERQKVLNALTVTASNMSTRMTALAWGTSGTCTTWQDAVSAAISSFQERAFTASPYPDNRLYAGIATFGQVYNHPWAGYPDQYKAGVQAARWAVAGTPSNAFFAVSVQTYHTLKGVAYTVFGGTSIRYYTPATYQASWDNQPIDTAEVDRYWLADVQSVSPSNAYSPVVYGTLTRPEFGTPPNLPTTNSLTEFRGEGMRVADTYPEYAGTNVPAYPAIGIFRWDVTGGFNYR